MSVKAIKENVGGLSKQMAIAKIIQAIYGLERMIRVFGAYNGKYLTNYTIKDGLSANVIMTIYKDAKGVL